MDKKPFDIDVVIERIASAVEPYPKAALFELAEEGYTTPFEQLLACMISIRTYDEMTVKLARTLFARARTPEEILKLTSAEIDQLIYGSTFHERKAQQMREIAEIVIIQYSGKLPCEQEALLALPGIGVKCANLVLGIACNQLVISVDVHVHRATNRWGYVMARSPEKTMEALQLVLPERYAIEINRLLVPFGKHICTGLRPRCSTCPVLEMCRQVGVTEHR
jgi:endonuclease III